VKFERGIKMARRINPYIYEPMSISFDRAKAKG